MQPHLSNHGWIAYRLAMDKRLAKLNESILWESTSSPEFTTNSILCIVFLNCVLYIFHVTKTIENYVRMYMHTFLLSKDCLLNIYHHTTTQDY